MSINNNRLYEKELRRTLFPLSRRNKRQRRLRHHPAKLASNLGLHYLCATGTKPAGATAEADKVCFGVSGGTILLRINEKRI